ncbi:alpha/beta hydrolase [Silvimonas iriomotensis]|uniref:Serine aminopeptidase S33 domain-containing protein n=1 Tax=Silvimonas iriomotensis TaxID=449662 RepID=A0ABQ2P6C0_9NEIS|nr:alpha/beta hydrolase [Silvimonas iriomotensis]GGP19281.1 hypothetical protein GCM10010970_09830 [Silvimonas iriomotensis]
MLRFTLCMLLACVSAVAFAAPHFQVTWPAAKCRAPQAPVAVIVPGYGLSGDDYTFLQAFLTQFGYGVVVYDGQIGRTTPLLLQSSPLAPQLRWLADQTARAVSDVLQQGQTLYPQGDWHRVLLVGHSLGGDAAALLASWLPERISALITLDNRRVPLPVTEHFKVLSIRATDTVADPGVLPSAQAIQGTSLQLVTLQGAHHNDMQDAGPEALKQQIRAALTGFLRANGLPECHR